MKMEEVLADAAHKIVVRYDLAGDGSYGTPSEEAVASIIKSSLSKVNLKDVVAHLNNLVRSEPSGWSPDIAELLIRRELGL